MNQDLEVENAKLRRLVDLLKKELAKALEAAVKQSTNDNVASIATEEIET